ncbi:hypothetical protein PRVXH_001390 [Proteinivorax hydrogeniformans]|uniref:Uncharacterized protein n=1 Tax=Proteinivorax hydrogeniformans TaxID=1826727 RepID=A0AAU8HP18_9FIRM
MLKKISFSNLCIGFACGIVATLCSLFMYIYFSYGLGVSVRVDLEKLLPQVNEMVTEVTKEQIPTHLEQAQSDIPGIIDEHMSGQINDAFLKIGDLKVALPEEMVGSMEKNFKQNVEYSMLELLANIDENELAQSIAADIESTAEVMLTEHFNDNIIQLKPTSFFTIPVTVIFNENDEVVPAMNLNFN